MPGTVVQGTGSRLVSSSETTRQCEKARLEMFMDCKINDLNPRILSFVDISLPVKQCTVRSLYCVRHNRSKDRNV